MELAEHGGGPGGAAVPGETSRDRRVVVLICDEPLQWEFFQLIENVESIRAVSCSSLRQMLVSFATTPPVMVVLDADRLGEDPDSIRTVRGLIGNRPHLVVLTDGSCGEYGRMAAEKTSILVKPVSAVQVLHVLRGRPTTSYVKTFGSPAAR